MARWNPICDPKNCASCQATRARQDMQFWDRRIRSQSSPTYQWSWLPLHQQKGAQQFEHWVSLGTYQARAPSVSWQSADFWLDQDLNWPQHSPCQPTISLSDTFARAEGARAQLKPWCDPRTTQQSAKVSVLPQTFRRFWSWCQIRVHSFFYPKLAPSGQCWWYPSFAYTWWQTRQVTVIVKNQV